MNLLTVTNRQFLNASQGVILSSLRPILISLALNPIKTLLHLTGSPRAHSATLQL